MIVHARHAGGGGGDGGDCTCCTYKSASASPSRLVVPYVTACSDLMPSVADVGDVAVVVCV